MKWHRRLLGIGLIILAFELGLFLVIFPWLDSWSMNWIPVHSARFAGLWMSGYFRGSLSGLGLLNIYVALAEAIKQITSLIRRSPVQQ